MKPKIQTSRLLLKPFSAEDANFVLDLYNSPKFLKFVGDRNIRTEEDAIKFIKEKMISQMRKLGFGNYVIINKETGEKLGGVGIFARENVEVMDIGFSLLPQYHGFGYAFEAATLLIKYVREKFGLKKVSAITMGENSASRNLIEKLGLTYKKKIYLPNDSEELMYFEKTFNL